MPLPRVGAEACTKVVEELTSFNLTNEEKDKAVRKVLERMERDNPVLFDYMYRMLCEDGLDASHKLVIIQVGVTIYRSLEVQQAIDELDPRPKSSFSSN